MKREIKFRAWDFEAKEMIYPSLPFNEKYVLQLNCEYMGEFNGKTYDTIKMPLMQFTGLKDRNGIEIYEDDFVRIELKSHSQDEPLITHEVYRIVWQQDRMRFGLRDDKDLEDSWAFTPDEDFEVVGNIHENPDLLK
jgi:uncharacterized phage protein (TIGR01671 family)